ncbi:serine/threonine-protein kinase [Tahibacter amnicola]|uniref:Serine/threonine-protein kinase n=1 Tax=Tahibacter amnicola TaxID=2976241 RepID=A0ABY6BKA1_9GAMM|nr:serine/threonine-protein kinase [Tahibacter amnicola]UXI69823.1 serine/threonine-protein kinase [Tahibacter amnicola]
MKTPPERIRRLGELFDEALDLDPVAREALLERCMADDPQLAADLAKLIRRDQKLIGSATRSAVSVVEAGLDALENSALQPGATIGVYTLEEEIGQGGMGRVFRATRVGPDFTQEVAIKFVRRDVLHPALLRRFSTERAILASLDHPGISRLIDANTTADGTPFVVMEFVRGRAIDDWCDARRLGIKDRLRLFRKVLAAVGHAHRNLVVHRDIKASNVLVTNEGEIRLLDFGIAKPLGRIGHDKATMTMDRFLTPSSAAPEQLAGGAVTVACDIHALGMLLYELLCGRLPFAFGNMTPGEIEHAIRHVPPPPMASRLGENDRYTAESRGFSGVRDLRSALRGDLEHVVQRCLRKRPEERYGTVDQLDLDIDHVLAGHPIRERQSDRWYRWRKFLARHSVASALVAGLLFTIGTAVVAIVRQNIAIAHERDRAQRAVGLLKEAFAAANPMQVGGAQVTATDVLEAARPQLESTFDSQPDVYADLAGTMAEVELAVGRSPQAAALAERARLASEKAQLPNETVTGLLVLEARARISSGDYDIADDLLTRAANISPVRTPEWKLARGMLLLHRSHFADSIATLEQAVESFGQRPASDDDARLARLQLAEALRRGDRGNDALSLLDTLYQEQSRGLSPNHPRVTLVRLYRVSALRSVGRRDEALEEAKAVVAEADRTYGQDSTVAATARGSLGMCLDELNRPLDAVDAFRTSLRAWRKAVGDDHQNTLRTAFNVALALTRANHSPDEAESLYKEVLVRGGTQDQSTRLPVMYWRIAYVRALIGWNRVSDAANELTSPVALEQFRTASPRRREEYAVLAKDVLKELGCESSRSVDTEAQCKAVESLMLTASNSGTTG